MDNTWSFNPTPLDWLYPIRCMACNQIIPAQMEDQRRLRLCGHCRVLFEKLEPPLCKYCGHPLTESQALGAVCCDRCLGREYAFINNKATFLYEGVLRDILHDIKFRSRKQSAVGLGRLWASLLDGDTLPPGCILVPVPMHPNKVRRRGFNQAEILARTLAEETGVEAAPDLLLRTADTPPQSGLTAHERVKNVSGVFALNKRANIKGKVIMLIDDIFTTGASLNACANVLTDADKIYSMTLTIALRDNKSVI